MPVVLVFWKAGIIHNQKDFGSGQPGPKKFARPHLHIKKLGMEACTYHPRNGRKHKIGGSLSRPAWAKKQDTVSKKYQSKSARGMAQEVESLTSKFAVLSSNPSSTCILPQNSTISI
jgi:hypothetical protein